MLWTDCVAVRKMTDGVVTSLQEEMAAASLDVNFKEELSAIEQCTSISACGVIRIRNVEIIFVDQGSGSFPRPSAPLPSIRFSSTPPKFRFASSSQSFSKWPVRIR